MEQPKDFRLLGKKKKKSGDFTKYCTALSKLAYLGGRLQLSQC